MYKIIYKRSALTKDLPKLKSANLMSQFFRAIDLIRDNPFAGKQLTGPMKGKYSMRINLQHRIFYTIDQNEVAEKGVLYKGAVNILQAFGHDLN